MPLPPPFVFRSFASTRQLDSWTGSTRRTTSSELREILSAEVVMLRKIALGAITALVAGCTADNRLRRRSW